MVSPFSPLRICRGVLHRQVSSRTAPHFRCFHVSRKLLHPLHPRLILLQLSYASQSKLIPGMLPPRTLKWGSRKCSALSNDNTLEEDCKLEGEGKVGDASISRIFTENFSTGDEETSSFRELLHEIDEKTQVPKFDANLASDEGAVLSQDNLTWLQKHFIMVVGPIVRVLSGAHLSKPLQKSKWQEDTTSWSLLKDLTGSLPPEYHRRRIGRKLRQAEADFFMVSFLCF